jgi:putative NIF3 family GTP cyclohydrolase 1 type 2
VLELPLSADEIFQKAAYKNTKPLALLPFGKAKNTTAAIIAGSAVSFAYEAIKDNIDIYITGEANHEIYQQALENKINILALGHYASEVYGVQSVMAKVLKDFSGKVECEFLDVATGL